MRRSGRRLGRAALFALETLGAARDEDAPRDDRARARRLSWIAENVCALHGIHVVCRGPVPNGPVVLVSNHLGYLDPPALVSLVPALPVAKRELGDWPVVGELLRGHGVLLVDRDDPHSGARILRRATRALEAGAAVLTFPEGTTSEGRDVLPFRRGIFGIARRTGVPVVPVTIRYDTREACWVGDATFLPHYVRTTTRPRVRVDLAFAPALPRAFDSAEALAAFARELIRVELPAHPDGPR
ncbi:MAG TPA: lysophospholipid acyltransferase family protein [Sandaracinaceae bacterium LLY-WYZ-13_1]|nr:lysophospholipid acyltransferase family protein [Sandaracinaceae bacterium LLY-WYZ-13_1]